MSGETVLVAEDDQAVRTVVTRALSRQGYEVRATSVASALWRWIADGAGDVVITDVALPDENSLDLLPRIKGLRPDLPIIVMSAQNTLLTAVRATERGAFDYLPKPFDIEGLLATVRRSLDRRGRRAAVESPPIEDSLPEPMPIIGRSSAMQDIYRVIARLTQTDLTVLIAGESGTGKELVAR
ncbi:MAG: response regulator, partial [Geminicoccaceae bacterium]|nr:response regulator [Geminicoccaceae bacterium]